MNSFGTLFRVNIFGESHGPAVGITLDGVPSGISLKSEDLEVDIQRRKGGLQPGTTPRKEEDDPVFLSGLFNDKTTGAPLTILFENKNTRSTDYDALLNTPRPGHADLTSVQKYGPHRDHRGGGHFSGRLTLCLVAAGVVAKKILQAEKINCAASLIEAGGEADIEKAIQKAIDANDSIGGIVECRVTGLPAGLGEPFFDSAESLLSHMAFSIPAVKGIEFGSGFSAARMFGSVHNDAISNEVGTTVTNNAGGISGGISNSNELVFRIAVKPASSTPKEQFTYNKASGKQEAFSVKGRHDLCIALRVPVVLEAAAAIVLADLLLLNQNIKRVL